MEATQQALTIETAFRWGQPEEIDTKLGKRIRRKAPKTPDADAWFEGNRRECAVAGIVYGEWPPNSNKWAYTWWQQIPKDITDEREKNAELSRATHSDHDIPHPKGMDYFGYQKAGIVFMRGKMGVLLADDLGLGKTCQIIGRINDEPKICKVLIAVPAYLTINWEREIRRWLVRNLSVGVADGKCLPTSDIVIISHGMLVKWEEQLCSRHWDLFAVDEAHAFKNPKAQRSRVVLGYKPKRDEPVSMARAPLPARQRVFATGTPLCNKPEDLWPLVSLLCPTVFNNWYRFHTRYCGLRQGDFGMVREKDGMNLGELQETLRANVMIRRLKREVLKDLPPLRRTIVTFEAPPGVIAAERSACHGKATDDLQDAIERAMKDATTDEARYIAAAASLKTVGIDFDKMSIVRHQTALAKVPLCIEHVTNLLEETDEKIIVWAHHKDVMEKMAEGLSKYGVLVSHGGHSVAVRQGNVDRFQSDPDIRVHVCSITGMGTGNTQTAATTAVFVELDWMPSNNTQAESRCIAEGQLVLTPDGWRKIEDIKVGDLVIGGCGRPRKVTDAWSSYARRPMAEISLEGWFETIVVTADHKLLRTDGEWVEAADLRPGDVVAQPTGGCPDDDCNSIEFDSDCRLRSMFLGDGNGNPTVQRNGRLVHAPEHVKLTEEALFTFGYFAGDGFAATRCNSSRSVGFAGNQLGKKDSLDRVSAWANSVGMTVSYYPKKHDKGAEVRAYSGEWAIWFAKHFGQGAHNKRLPDFCFNLSRRQTESLLEGLIASDGYVRNGRWEYATVSQVLAGQVASMMLRSGRKPCITRGNKDTINYWVVSCGLAMRPGLNVESVTIRHARRRPVPERIYDLTVEGSSFVVGTAVVHNCHRIGQRESVLVQHLVCSGTIDARLVEVTIAKQEMADQALNLAPSVTPQATPKVLPASPTQVSDHERLAAKMNIAAADAILAKTWALAVRCRPKNVSTSGIDRADAAVITKLSESPMLAPRDAATALLLLTKYQKLVGLPELRALYAHLS